MHKEITAIMNSADTKSRLDTIGTLSSSKTPAEFDSFIAAETVNGQA
jgi:tripartite-type tricarboxylate transporter receptor subunit TctC